MKLYIFILPVVVAAGVPNPPKGELLFWAEGKPLKAMVYPASSHILLGLEIMDQINAWLLFKCTRVGT
jgi:hypothetical protein